MIPNPNTLETTKSSIDENDELKMASILFSRFNRNSQDPHDPQSSIGTKIVDGNMNLVIHFSRGKRQFLIKHARPWVERFPTIAAPIERTSIEAMFYKYISLDSNLKNMMPRFIGFNPSENIIVLDYIEDSKTLFELYQRKENTGIPMWASDQVMHYFAYLHALDLDDNDQWRNLKIRKLNHEYLFLEFFSNSRNSAQDRAQSVKNDIISRICTDEELRHCSQELGQVYLTANSGSLLHGDLHPGSMLTQGSRLYIIDPEFCFVGPREFDLGVYFAHLMMLGGSPLDCDILLTKYDKYCRHFREINRSLIGQFCGVEILRRLLGTAQIPTLPNDERVCELLNLASGLVKRSIIL